MIFNNQIIKKCSIKIDCYKEGVNSMNKKEDRRVLYTKMFLREALLDLMSEKPVDRITPTELCRRANINRNTFYSHYYSVRELLQSIEDELKDEIISAVSTKLQAGNVSVLLCEICEMIYKKKDLYRVLLSEYGDTKFLEDLIETVKDFVIEDWLKKGMKMDESTCDLVFKFFVDGSLSLIRHWAQNDMVQLPQEIAGLIDKLNYGGISSLK